MQHPRSIILVRHGQTAANAAERVGRFFETVKDIARLDGKADHKLPLSERGREQARQAGRLLVERWPFKRFDIYYDSGSERSIETLDLILESFPESEREPDKRRSHLDLRERDSGYPYLMTIDEGRRFFPWWEQYEQQVGPVYSRPPGGESLADAWMRVHMFLNSLRRSRPGKEVLIVTHGRLMLGFKYWLEKLPARDVDELYHEHKDIANCEVWWYRHDCKARRYVREDTLTGHQAAQG